jgi:hypothetical protein
LALDTPDPPDPDQPKPMHVMLLDPAGDTWRVGEPIPGPPRREFAWVWTGQRLLVWGGVHTSTGYYDERALPAEEASEAWWDAGQQHWVVGRAEWLADGWAYDPDADTWAPISPAPVPGASRSYAAWTGTEMIVWGGTTGADVWPYQPDPAGAAYNPATDTWRTIADAPADATGEMIVFPSVWTGTEFMVWSEQSFDEPCVAAAYNPATDTWRALPDSPMRNVSHAVWTGDSVLVTGYLSDDVRTGEQPAFAHIVEYQPGPYR